MLSKFFIEKARISYLFTMVLILSLILFSFCSKDTKNPVKEEYEDVYTKAYDQEKVIRVESGLKVVGNQVVIRFSEDVEPESAELTIINSSGELVGQIPALGLFQAEYAFHNEQELNDKIDELSEMDNIELVSYNAIAERRDLLSVKPYCKKNFDNHKLPEDQSVAYREIEFFPAIPLMGHVRKNMNLSEVVIGIFDCKIEQNKTREFDDVTVKVKDTAPNANLAYTEHATQIAGVIAADNGDGGVNGIASTLIEDKLKVYSYNNNNASLIKDIEMLFLACSMDDVDIINMSYGFGGFIEGTNYLKNCVYARGIYEWAFRSFPEVLFVCAAANEKFEISQLNDAPAGIQLPNVITVSGTKFGDPLQASPWCSYGSLIDIAAPNEKLALLDSSSANTIQISDGNSFAAPMVAATAGVLKSLKPDLLPEQIKDYILDYASPTDESVGGRRLNIPMPVEQLLIEMNAPEAILEKVDDSEPFGEPDAIGIVECRICGHSVFKIEGEPALVAYNDSTSFGFLNHMGGGITMTSEYQTLAIEFNTYDILSSQLPIAPDDEIPRSVAIGYYNQYSLVSGTSRDGDFNIESAEITQYNQLNQNPLSIRIIGSLKGNMTLVQIEDMMEGVPYNRKFSGSFNILMILQSEDEDFLEYIDTYCIK